jgi:hypothetical protein
MSHIFLFQGSLWTRTPSYVRTTLSLVPATLRGRDPAQLQQVHGHVDNVTARSCNQPHVTLATMQSTTPPTTSKLDSAADGEQWPAPRCRCQHWVMANQQAGAGPQLHHHNTT